MNHSKKIVILIAALCFSFSCFNVIEAARLIPKEVKPVIYNGTKYIANRFSYVEAWDVKSGKKLWEKKVYTVIIDPMVEEDVQWVFISSLSIEDGKLLVVNERNYKYKIDLNTGKVISGFPIIGFPWITLIMLCILFVILRFLYKLAEGIFRLICKLIKKLRKTK